MQEPANFADKHRAQLGLSVQEQGGRLRAGPQAHSMTAVVLWMSFVHVIIIIFVFSFGLYIENPKFFLLFFAAMALEFPAGLGILFAINRHERGKGPLLEVDEGRRVVSLLRDARIYDFDDIEAVALLVGWYEWTDWHEVAEMSLIVRGEGDRLETVPVVLHNGAKLVEDLAERVARLLDKPLHRTRLGWEDRQHRIGRGR